MANTLTIGAETDRLTDGESWTVLHHMTGSITKAHPYGENMLPYKLEEGDTINLSHWEEVATITNLSRPLMYRLTNNVDESWSRDFVGDHEHWSMTLEKPLEIDEEGKEWGHRSTSKHDIFRNNETGEMFILQGYGYAPLA